MKYQKRYAKFVDQPSNAHNVDAAAFYYQDKLVGLVLVTVDNKECHVYFKPEGAPETINCGTVFMQSGMLVFDDAKFADTQDAILYMIDKAVNA